jgi:hypothetical protein
LISETVDNQLKSRFNYIQAKSVIAKEVLC